MSAEFMRLGSARASRAASGALAKCTSNKSEISHRKRLSGEGAGNRTRGACAPQT
jgi:hypothetical protein